MIKTGILLHRLRHSICDHDDAGFQRLLKKLPSDKINESVDEDGMRLLHIACISNNCCALKNLLKIGNIDVNVFNKFSTSPLRNAFCKASIECLEILLEDERVDVFIFGQFTYMDDSKISLSDRKTMDKMIIKERHIRIAMGCVPLHLQLMTYIHNRDDENVSEVLEKMTGDEVNKGDVNGWTAIFNAVLTKECGSLEQLLKFESINVNAKFHHPMFGVCITPFDFAVVTSYTETVEILLNDSRVDLFQCFHLTHDGTTQNMIAEERRSNIETRGVPLSKRINMITEERQRRIEKGGVPLYQQLFHNIVTNDGETVDEILNQMKHGEVNECDLELGLGALHITCLVNDSKATSKLLKIPDINVNSLDFLSRTPWKVAIEYGSIDCLKILATDLRVDFEAGNNIDLLTFRMSENRRIMTMNCVEDLCRKRERIMKHKNKRKQHTKCEVTKSDIQIKNCEAIIGDIDDILQFIEGENKKVKKKNKVPSPTEDISKKKQKKKIELLETVSNENDKVVRKFLPCGKEINPEESPETLMKNCKTCNICNLDEKMNTMEIINEIPEQFKPKDIELNQPKKQNKLIDKGSHWIDIGKLSYNPRGKIGSGSLQTIVYEGVFQKRKVAVKRLLKERYSIADRETTLLLKADNHPNIIRHFITESCEQFVYIVLERCDGNLEDLVEGRLLPKENPVDMLQILHQCLSGIHHLHSLSPPIVHRDIKPSNILLLFLNDRNSIKVLVSDLGCSKQIESYEKTFAMSGGGLGLTGTLGWMAPEMWKMAKNIVLRATLKIDIFSFGLVSYYALSSGCHPFGEPHRRDGNIEDNKYDLGCLDNRKDCLALDIIEKMIDQDHRNRPSALTALKHPLFWPGPKIKDFFMKVSDILESNQKASNVIEKKCTEILPENGWMDALDDNVQEYLRKSKYRIYDGMKIKDLLRAIRNLAHHYNSVGSSVQASLGNLDEEFIEYWRSRFPELLLHTYHVMTICQSCEDLKLFYDSNFES